MHYNENLILIISTLLFLGSFCLITTMMFNPEVSRNIDLFILSLFHSKNKRMKEATQKLPHLMKVKPKNLMHKENDQLQTFFKKKGHLHYQVFTPNGEYYVQFQFKGNSIVAIDTKRLSTTNVLKEMNLLEQVVSQ